MVVRNYQDLKVWQKAMRLVSDVYATLEQFPKSEMYGLTSQIKRSAVSIPSNIAEGSARGSTKDFIRFLNIALGSLSEMETQFYIAQDLGYVDREPLTFLFNQSDEVGKMLRGLQKSLTEKLLEEV